jgi:hypothetical protein
VPARRLSSSAFGRRAAADSKILTQYGSINGHWDVTLPKLQDCNIPQLPYERWPDEIG